MRTSLPPADLAGCPVEELATSAPPARWHGPLQELGTHCRDGSWVIAGPQDVGAALASAALSVAPAAGHGGPAAELIASMARFSDGAEHDRRRDLLISMLPPVPRVAAAAGARANDYLRRRTAAFDIMPMARQLPAEVLAAALGLPPGAAERAATLTGFLCDAVTPSLQPREGTRGAGDAAAVDLADVVADGLGRRDADQITAAISILFQARDATAALIGSTVLARPRRERGRDCGPASGRRAAARRAGPEHQAHGDPGGLGRRGPDTGGRAGMDLRGDGGARQRQAGHVRFRSARLPRRGAGDGDRPPGRRRAGGRRLAAGAGPADRARAQA